MDFGRYIERLRRELTAGELPGLEAQRALAPPGRVPDDYHPEPAQARQAAVLICLTPLRGDGGESQPGFPVILRPDHDTTHAGQIALPGGQREDGEAFPAATALRETAEEIGIPPEDVRIAGELSPLFISVSNFSVVPVVGWIDYAPQLRLDPEEVAAAFFVPADELLAEPVYGTFRTRRGTRRAPYFPFREGRIWGATAMMLNEFAVLHRRALEAGEE